MRQLLIFIMLLGVMITPSIAQTSLSNLTFHENASGGKRTTGMEIDDPRSCRGRSFRLLKDEVGKASASIWSEATVDLSNSFEIDFFLKFSNKDDGADGITFTFQNQGVEALGEAGGYLGVRGISKALSVEFDIHPNGSALSDITNDHSNVSLNGNLAQAINPAVDLGNIEDDNWHPVKIKWDACDRKLCVTFDNQMLYCLDIDIVKDVFDGTSQGIYWGFTAGKYSQSSNHDICIQNVRIDPVPQIDQEFTFFSYQLSKNQDGTYGATVNALNPLPGKAGECGVAWEVVQIDQNGVPIPGTKVYNPSEWWLPDYGTSTVFPGYNGTIASDAITGPFNNSNPGKFDLENKRYRITRGVWCDCLKWNQWSIELNK